MLQLFESIIHQNFKELDLHLPTLSSSYIDLITKCSPPHLKSFSITIYNLDMYDWIEQTDWDDVLKLAQHMQLIPSVNISFIPGNGYDESQPRQESRMTKFYELLGAITMNRSSLYHSINANDLCPSNASIKIVKNKKAILEYGLDKEDYGEFPEQIAAHRQADDARRQEADPDRTPPTEPTDPTLISNAFQVPLPDINKA